MADNKTGQLSAWQADQVLKTKNFLSVVFAIILDVALILVVWGLREIVIEIVGVDPSTIQDRLIFWVVRLSEVGTMIMLALYVISDVMRHLFKAYAEIRGNFVHTVIQKTEEFKG